MTMNSLRNGGPSISMVHGNSVAIRQEIQRFESVHPSIYALYDLIEVVRDQIVQQQMRDHVVCIEDSFVNSQEWTLSRSVPDLRLGVVGTYNSGKSALVHRYLTGSYLQEESPEGGRFKKEVVVDGRSHLMLIRDEGGPPDMQFSQWVDAVILTFSLEDEISFNTVYTYHSQMAQHRAGLRDIPIILVGTQDAISEANPRVIDDSRSRLLANELKCCAYYETCATYGLNVERVFHDACLRIARASQVPLQLPMPSPGRSSPNNHNSTSRLPSRSGVNVNKQPGNHAPVMDQLTRGTAHRSSGGINGSIGIKSQSPPFREATPSSGSEIVMSDLPEKASLQRYQQNMECENNPHSSRQPVPLPRSSSSHSSMRDNAPPRSLPLQPLNTANEFTQNTASPPSTPGPTRKPSSFKNFSKSGSFSGMSLFRYASQSNLQSGYNDHASVGLPVVPLASSLNQKSNKTFGPVVSIGLESPNTGLTPLLDRKTGDLPMVSQYRFSLIVERIDAFLKELSKDRASPQQPSGLTQRVRSYSVQVLEQSGDSSRDFSSPSTTPTPARKNRRRSNIFSSKKDGEDKKQKNGDAKVGSGRVIPLKQGYLFKRSSKPLSKDWQKKYVTLSDDGHLTYHSTLHDYMEDIHGKEIKLIRTTVKIPGQMRPRGSESSSTSALPGNRQSNGQINGQAKQLDSSFEETTVNNQMITESMVIPNSSVTTGSLPDSENTNLSCSVPNGIGSFGKLETPNAKKKHRRIKSTSRSSDLNLDAVGGAFEFVIVSLDNKQWAFTAQTAEEREEWVVAIEQQIMSSLQLIESDKSKARLTPLANAIMTQTIRSNPGNGYCADCGTPGPDWASLNLGALICIECCGIHRNLGTHLSRVRSLELDDWPPELVTVMSSIGNKMANSIWETNTKGRLKPLSTSPREEKDHWIRCKYEQRDFVASLPYSDVPIHRQLFDAVARKDIHNTLLVLAHTVPSMVNTPYSDTDIRTPLHIAAAIGHVVLLQLLIWNGADVQLVDHEGFNAAYYAQIAKSPECVQLLQSAGCHAHPILRR